MLINGLDDIDNKILNLLLDNARMSYSEIADSVGLSRISVKKRIVNLEEQGVISGYHAIINPQKVQQTLTFIMDIETKPEHFDTVKNKLIETKEIMIVIHVTGNCRLLTICVGKSTDEIKQFAECVAKNVEGITSLRVQLVLDIFKGKLIPEK